MVLCEVWNIHLRMLYSCFSYNGVENATVAYVEVSNVTDNARVYETVVEERIDFKPRHIQREQGSRVYDIACG
jgi:hypothetical protein